MTELTPEQAEYFPTPRYAVVRFLERVELPGGPGGKWFEPCVGEGAIVRAVNSVRDDICWDANDIRNVPILECYDVLWRKDARLEQLWRRTYNWRVCITNPAFSIALPLVQRALERCDHVAIYQRLNWLASEERARWLRDHPPGVYVLPNRPSHTGNGRTDGAEYCWYLWPPQHTTVQILDSTPVAERRRDEREAFESAYRGPEQQVISW